MSDQRTIILETLAFSPLFNEVSKDYWLPLLPQVRVLSFEEKECVFRVGEQVTGLYIVIEGELQIDLDFIEGYSPLLTVFGRGNYVGELEQFGASPPLGTVFCSLPTQCIYLPGKLFMQIFQEQPTVAYKLVKFLAKNTRDLMEALGNWTSSNAELRLTRMLNKVYNIQANENPGFIVNASHEELAQMVGMTRGAVSKPLKKWKEQDWIDIGKKKLIVKRFDLILEENNLTT